MALFRILLVIFVVQFLYACASVVKNEPLAAVIAPKKSEPQKEVNALPGDHKKVETPLNSELLFNILAAEMAGRSGLVVEAGAFYANAARQSNDPDLALRAIQIAIFNKDIAKAKSMVDILLKKAQPNVQIHRLALTVYLAADNVEESLAQANKVIDLSGDPKRNTVLAVGDIITRSTNKRVAYGVVDGLIEKAPQDVAYFVVRSQVALRFRDLLLAKQSAEKALALDPGWSVAYIQLSRVYESEGNIKSALSLLKDASMRFSDNRITMKYGQLLAHNKEFVEAEKQFLSVLDADTSFHEARLSLALVFLKQGKINEAKQSFIDLFEADAFSSKSAFYLGRIDYSKGFLDSSLSWFLKVDQGESYLDAQANIALIKSKKGDLTGARKIATHLRKVYPSKAAQFYILEGEFLANARQYPELFKLMNEAVALSPNDLTLRYTRSIAAAELNKIDLVEKDLHTILNKEPNNVNALNALGYALASKTFRFKEARVYLNKALSFRPNDSAILDSMGWLNYRSGRYEDALVLLEKAYSQHPEAEIAVHLGETLWVLGRQEEAKQIWREAIKMHPNDERLAEVLKKIQ